MARNLGVAPLMIGLTIVSFATSAPEILVSIVAATRGEPDLAIGNAGDGNPDEFLIHNDAGGLAGNVEIYINSQPVFSFPRATTGEIVIRGSADDDTVIIDTTNGLIVGRVRQPRAWDRVPRKNRTSLPPLDQFRYFPSNLNEVFIQCISGPWQVNAHFLFDVGWFVAQH